MTGFLRGMGIVMVGLSVLGGLLLIGLGITQMRDLETGPLGYTLLVWGVVAALFGSVQGALVWAAGRGLDVLEEMLRFDRHTAALRDVGMRGRETATAVDLLHAHMQGSAFPPGRSASAPTPSTTSPAPSTPTSDGRFKEMAPGEAEQAWERLLPPKDEHAT